MRKIGNGPVREGPIKFSCLGTLLGITAVAVMMVVLQNGVLAAPPIEGNPISVQGPITIHSDSNGVMRAVVAADLDVDGHSDLAFAQANLLRIKRNTGVTTTQWAQTVAVGSAAYDIHALHAVDLDRDGAIDLVSAAADDAGNSQLRLWHNPTSPFANSWTVSHTLTTAAISLTSISSADLDRNGSPDLVSGGLDGVLRLWSNPLTGTQAFTTTWSSAVTISTPGDQIRQVLIADIDRDGLPDIIEAAGDDSAGVVRLWQNPGGPFNTAWTVSNTLGTFAATAQSLGVGDLDNNGTPDVVVGLSDGQVVAWNNPLTGSQAFTTSWGFSSSVGNLGLSIVGLELTDTDHDGWLDVVATGSGASSTLVGWRNTGQPFGGGWSQVTIGTPSDATFALAAADFNHDGDTDFVTASGNAGTNTGSMQYWTNVSIRSSVRFQTPNVSQSTADALIGIGLHAMDVHDMNRDGRPDIVVATLDGSLILLQNDGTPFFSGGWPTTTIGNSFGFFAVAAGDLDGDGWPDIVTSTTLTDTGGLVHVWRNDGTPFDGTWTSQIAGTFPRQVMDLALGDVARGGHLQIVASTGITTTFENRAEREVPTSDDNRIWLLRPPAGDPFASAWISSTVCTTTYSANGVALGDLDRDGWIDIVFATDHAPSGTTSWPDTSDWADAYQVRACRSLGNPYSSTGWQDYNIGRDDAPKSIVAGNHRFWGAHAWSVTVGDLNNDGYPDVASGGGAEGDYQVLVYKNDGTPFDGNIWEPTAVGYGTRPDGGVCPGYPEDCPWLEDSITAVNVGDLNGDGWLDLISGFGGSITVLPLWLNTGTPFGDTVTDTHWIRYDLSTGYSRPVYGVDSIDLDSDGRLDVAAVTSWDPQYSPASGPLRLWRNLGGIVQPAFETDYSNTTVENGDSEAVMTFAFKNNGRSYDHDLELDYLKIRLVDPGAMTNNRATALFQSLQIYRDANGDSTWQPTDSPVVTVTTFSLDNGWQIFDFPTGDSLSTISAGQTVTYFVVLNMQPTASHDHPGTFRMYYTPHQNLLVRDKDTQATVSVEEDSLRLTAWIQPVAAPAASVAMTAYPTIIQADGISTSTVTATVTTAHGYPVLDGTQITFTTSAGSLPASPYVTTTTNGLATAVLTSSTELTTATVTGTVSITATGTITVEFGAGPRASLRINDAPGVAGSEVTTHTMFATDTFTVYVAAYDAVGVFIGNPTDVTWGGTGVVTGHLSPTTGISFTTFAPTVIGTGTITVADGGGYIDATDTITVTDVPIAGLTATNDSPTPLGSTTTLTATIVEGSNVAYTWAFGDGSVGSGANVTHTYPSVGVYTAVVTATNSASVITGTTTVTVGVGYLTSIVIRDAPGGGGSEVDTHSMTIGDSFTVYAAGYDADGNYISDVAVIWNTTGDLDPIPTGPAASATFAPSTAGTSGFITADDGNGHTDATGIITVSASEGGAYQIFLPVVLRNR